MLSRLTCCLKAFLILTLWTLVDYFIFNERFEIIEKHESTKSLCGQYPVEDDIIIDNIIWQHTDHPRGFIKLLNAYMDLRQNNFLLRLNVHTSFKLNITQDSLYCQIWYNGSQQHFISEAVEFSLQWLEEWEILPGNTRPYLIACPFNLDSDLPVAVSLTDKPCARAQNLLKIINNQPINGTKQKFGVCSKQFMFNDETMTMRLIEWVHLCHIFGAEKIHFAVKYLHPDIYNAVKYFEEKGLIETVFFLEPSGISDVDLYSWQTFLLEMSMLTDCFYRVMNLYEYVVVIDIDEIIVPVRPEDSTWEHVIERMPDDSENFWDAYAALWVYYPNLETEIIPGIPSYLYTLQHIQRSVDFANVEKHNTKKCFIRTERAKIIHHHMPLTCINDDGWCNIYDIPTDKAQCSHYRNSVPDPAFNVTVEDKTLWKFKDALLSNVEETLREINFVP